MISKLGWIVMGCAFPLIVFFIAFGFFLFPVVASFNYLFIIFAGGIVVGTIIDSLLYYILPIIPALPPKRPEMAG